LIAPGTGRWVPSVRLSRRARPRPSTDPRWRSHDQLSPTSGVCRPPTSSATGSAIHRGRPDPKLASQAADVGV